MMEQKLSELVTRMVTAHGDRLRSIILYGSAAAGEHHGKYSDLNILCVLNQVSVEALAASEPVVKWWRENGNPSPLMLSEAEVATSTDCFPMEFHDMRERRRVLHGEDIIATLNVENTFYRAQVEHELRAKLLRLRQKGAGLLSDKSGLLRLMLDSVSTFLVLARHALLLSGVSVGWSKRETLSSLHRLGINVEPFSVLLDIREEKMKEPQSDPVSLFGRYLGEIEKLVACVDQLEK